MARLIQSNAHPLPRDSLFTKSSSVLTSLQGHHLRSFGSAGTSIKFPSSLLMKKQESLSLKPRSYGYLDHELNTITGEMGKDVSASRSIPLFWKIVTMHQKTPRSSARELVRTRKEAGAFPQQYQKLLIKIPCFCSLAANTCSVS